MYRNPENKTKNKTPKIRIMRHPYNPNSHQLISLFQSQENNRKSEKYPVQVYGQSCTVAELFLRFDEFEGTRCEDRVLWPQSPQTVEQDTDHKASTVKPPAQFPRGGTKDFQVSTAKKPTQTVFRLAALSRMLTSVSVLFPNLPSFCALDVWSCKL